MRAKKRALWIGGAVAVLLAAGVAGGAAVQSARKPDASKDGGDGKPQVTLEFTPREVVAPTLATLSSRIEFSGPLVAPQTAVVRAKTGGTLLTLSVAEGHRVTEGARTWIPCSGSQSRSCCRWCSPSC